MNDGEKESTLSDTEPKRPTSIRGTRPSLVSRDDPLPQRILKISILAAPWITGIILLWDAPAYLAVFLIVSLIFVFVQRARFPVPGLPTRPRDNEDDDARD